MFRPILFASTAAALLAAMPARAEFSCQHASSSEPRKIVEFQTGSAKLVMTPAVKAELDRFARDVNESYATNVCIVGRASKLGDPAKNKRLAEERAQTIAAELRKRNVKRDIITAEAAGEAYQSLFGTSTNNAQDDRRVEYWFNRP